MGAKQPGASPGGTRQRRPRPTKSQAQPAGEPHREDYRRKLTGIRQSLATERANKLHRKLPANPLFAMAYRLTSFSRMQSHMGESGSLGPHW